MAVGKGSSVIYPPPGTREIVDAILTAAYLNILMSAAIAFCMSGGVAFLVAWYGRHRRLARRRRALARKVFPA